MMTFKKLGLQCLAAGLLVGALSACAPMLLGGAMMTSMVAVDRRTAGMQLEDENIERRAMTRVDANVGDRGHVNVTSYNRKVLITGEVPTEQDKALLAQLISRLDNVAKVENELAVMGKSTLTQRSTDVLVTSRVKANFIDAKDVFSGAMKIVTERGVVYLFGRVTHREADRATDITRNTAGVLKVVRMFEIISEEDLQRLSEDNKPAHATGSSSPK
jgi:osmotically-inducible protein OsmY